MLTHWLPLNGIYKQSRVRDWKSTNISYVNGLFGRGQHRLPNCKSKIWLENPIQTEYSS